MSNLQNNAKFEPTHTYVDVDIINNNLKNNSPKPLVFNQIKSQNIIDDCSLYHASVIRWSADSCLPVFIPEMQTRQNQFDTFNGETVYYLNMGIGAEIASIVLIDAGVGQNVVWLPQNNNSNYLPNWSVPVLKPVSQIEILNNPFFYASSIEQFLTCINKALYVLWQKLMNVSTDFPNAQPPEFRWNSSVNKIDFLATRDYTNQSATTDSSRIWVTMNAPLYNLLNTFNYEVVQSLNGVNYNFEEYQSGMPFVLNNIWKYDTPFFTSPNGFIFFQFISESSPVPSWTPISSIVFVSYTIPVNSTESGTPQFLGPNPTGNNAINNISNVISDFEIGQDVGTEIANSVLSYTPTAEYRLLDLNSNQALNNLVISVFWKDKWGQNHVYYLKYGGSATLKLLFRKKNFESSNVPENLYK